MPIMLIMPIMPKTPMPLMLIMPILPIVPIPLMLMVPTASCPVLLQASLQGLQDFDLQTAQSIQRVLRMEGPALAALMQLEGLPQNMTGKAYVEHIVQRVCVEDVKWQATSFAQVSMITVAAVIDPIRDVLWMLCRMQFHRAAALKRCFEIQWETDWTKVALLLCLLGSSLSECLST